MVDNISHAKKPTTLASWVLLVAEAIESYGFDSKNLFHSVGLDLDSLKKPSVRIPASLMVDIWQKSIELTKDPYIALAVANISKPTAFSALGMALAASQNIYDAMQRCARYSSLVNDGSVTSVEENEGEVAFKIVKKNKNRSQEYFPGVEAMLGCMFNLACSISSNTLRAKAVYFEHDFKADKKPFEDFFKCPVFFSSSSNKMVFDRKDIFEQNAFSNSLLTITLDEWIEDQLTTLSKDILSSRVIKYLLKHMAYGEIDLHKVSNELALSPRLLQRKLKDEGTSYTKLLDDCRCKLALKLISHNKMSLTEITYILGFSDQSNFSRAFKRWTGIAPQLYKGG